MNLAHGVGERVPLTIAKGKNDFKWSLGFTDSQVVKFPYFSGFSVAHNFQIYLSGRGDHPHIKSPIPATDFSQIVLCDRVLQVNIDLQFISLFYHADVCIFLC